MQAAVDAEQDKMIQDLKEQMTGRIEQLQKEIKKVRMAGAASPSTFNNAFTSQLSR